MKRFLIILSFILFFYMALPSTSFGERPIIIVGDDKDYPPYSFLDEHGNPTGFNVELITAAANAMGYDVHIKLDNWVSVRHALEEGDIDVISGMFYSIDREHTYRFSSKHSVTTGDIFTRTGTVITDISELSGKTIVVQSGDIMSEYLASLPYDFHLIEVNTVKEALSLVDQKTYDFAGVLRLPGLYHAERHALNVVSQSIQLVPNDYCFAVLKDSEDILLVLNAGLQIIKATGEYDKIYNKWLGIYEERPFRDFLYDMRMILILFISIVAILILINRFLQKKLTISKERSRAILKLLPDAVYLVDKQGKILDSHASNQYHFPKIKAYVASESILNKIKIAIQTGVLQSDEYEVVFEGIHHIYEIRIVKSLEDEAICIVRDVSIERSYLKRIEYLSYHDQMTGLYNRRYYEEALRRLNIPNHLPLAFIVCDVNGLKLVNDAFGHQVGDELIVSAALTLKHTCRSNDIIARIGGDEFMIIMANCDDTAANIFLMRLQDAFKDIKIGFIQVSMSFGLAIKHHESENVEEVIKTAEENMYNAKVISGSDSRKNIVHAIISTLNERDEHENSHSSNVERLCRAFAEYYGFSHEEADIFALAGRLHDIGKIAVSHDLLVNPLPLSLTEMNEVKKHAEIGYRILNSVNDMADIAYYILHHHERWDGGGYPAGLKEKDIPLQSRMLCIIDAFDAMTHSRPYKEKMSPDAALQILEQCAGTQFDPQIVTTFNRFMKGL